MSPLLIVGMLISLTAGDVSHLLQNRNNPDSNLVNPSEVNYLAQSGAGANAFASSYASAGSYSGARSGSYSGAGAGAGAGGFAGGAAGTSFAGGAGNGDAFWWADNNSPFKHAYDQFKKCSLKGNCYPQAIDSKSGVQQSVSDFVNAGLQSTAIDVKKNPFLNGQFQGVAIQSCSGTACKNGKPQTVVTTCDGNDCKTSTVEGQQQQQQQGGNGGSFSFSGGSVGQFDASKNPFLNGQFAGAGAGAFAGGNTVTSGNGAQIEAKEGFLGVQPSQPFASKKPFASTYPQQSVNQGAQPFPVSIPSSSSSYSTNNKQPFSSTRPFASSGAFSGSYAGNSGVEQLKLGGVACQGSGYICVAKSQCVNGIASSSSAGIYQAANRVSSQKLFAKKKP